MAEFQRMSGEKVTSPCTAVVGGNLHLKAVPQSSEPLPTITVAPVTIAKVVHIDALKGPHFTIFQLHGVAAGTATLEATGGKPSRTLAGPITIIVEKRVALPPAGTNAGLFVRLFLAETLSPDLVTKKTAQTYTKDNLETVMRWMRVVVENRLAKPSAQWGSAGAKTLADVVKAPGQFKGFSTYPVLTNSIQTLIERYFSIANDGDDGRRSQYKMWIDAALTVAAMPTVPDPSSGLYWWRTSGSGKPFTDAKVFADKLGNTFYTR